MCILLGSHVCTLCQMKHIEKAGSSPCCIKDFYRAALHSTSFLGVFVYRLPSALLETSGRQPLLSLFDPFHALEQSHGSEAPSELLKSQEGEVLGPLWLWYLTWHMMALD